MDQEKAKEVIEGLRAEGFSEVYVWTDRPDTVYPDHTHPTETAHVVLEGEIVVTTADGTKTYHVGERFDVPADTIHSAEVGPEGCLYVVGER